MTPSDGADAGTPERKRVCRRLIALCLLASLVVSASAGTVAGHPGHEESTPTVPLEPSEVPPWFRPLVGGLGALVAISAAKMIVDERTARQRGLAGLVVGLALLTVAVFAQPQWF